MAFSFLKKEFLKYLDSKSMLETKPLNKLTKNKKLIAHKHDGFYQCIDFLNEKNSTRVIKKI